MKKKTLLFLIVITGSFLFYMCLQRGNHSADKMCLDPIIIQSLQDTAKKTDSIYIDCGFTFEEVTSGIDIPQNIRGNLALINVSYLGFDSMVHQGQIVVSRHLASEMEEIFEEILRIRFPIERAVPVSAYNWSDSLSMIENNTSCFNYRRVPGCNRLSHHALGIAIDINPRLNPYYQRYTNIKYPYNAVYDTSINGTLVKGSEVVTIFKRRGWKWGGDWYHAKDYQHFYKAY